MSYFFVRSVNDWLILRTIFPFNYRWLPIATGLLLLVSAGGVQAKAERKIYADTSDSRVPSDTTRRFRPDRVLMLTDTSKQAQQQVRTQEFYKNLKSAFYQTRLTKEIFDLLFTEPRQTQPKNPDAAVVNSIERYEGQEDKFIGNIKIRKLPLFGPTVTDTSQTANTWYKKLGNSIHIPTRNWVIRKNLLFETGQQVNPYDLADTERLLRDLSFIRDARIHLQPRSDSDTVDVLVVTQDVLPYSLGGSYRSLDNLSLIIENNNMAGVGHELSNELLYDQRQVPSFGYRGIYAVPNIAATFINGQLEYAETDYEEKVGLHLQRPFFTPNVRWAGGFQLDRTELKRGILFLDSEQDSLYHYRYHHLNFWGARAFQIRSSRHETGERSRFVVGARVSRTDYRMRPDLQIDNGYYFQDRSLYLSSIGWSRREYFQDQYLFGFGRTEDVPYGSLLNFTFGLEDTELSDRSFTRLSMAAGRYFWEFGYLYGQLDLESYFYQNGQSTQRLLHFQSDYYSPLLKAGSYRIRQLFTVDYTYGDRRLEHEFLTIGYENIRGLSTYRLRGTQRYSMGLETIAFSPLYIIGFQLAGFVFADFAILNNYDSFSLQGKSFQGYGIGLRVRNENLTFNTFQLRFSIYPNTPDKAFGIRVSGNPSQLFNDFQIGEPRPFSFR